MNRMLRKSLNTTKILFRGVTVHMMVVFVDSSTNMNDERCFFVEQSGGGGDLL